LGVHETIASELLYPALQAQTCRYDAKVQVLQQLFRLHVRDEETQILPESAAASTRRTASGWDATCWSGPGG
jgi:hypothetical protein